MGERSDASVRQPEYVDDARCANCHDGIYETYQAHPMGRSMAPVAELIEDDILLPENAGALTAGNYRYAVLHRDGRILHSETVLDEEGRPLVTTTLPVAFAVGSAERGRSFLIDRDNRLYMSPITWYAQKGAYDLSPGYEDTNSHFNRPVVVQCLFCHANRSHPVDGTLNTYREPIFSGQAIGCQRCHGPGEQHVALQQGAATASQEETIINPAKLTPKLREAVCQQCHLSGAAKVLRRDKELYDFRPGMPLEDVLRVFVTAGPADDTARFVGHVEQMYASRCFRASDGQMGCISCHDPHEQPPEATRIDYFRARCLDCHEEESCTESNVARQAANDNCMQCHMPSLGTEIRHAAITDHRILRRPDAARVATADGPSTALVPFHETEGRDGELSRDRALALLRAEDADELPLDNALLQRAANDLQTAVQIQPNDVAAWEGLGIAIWRLGDLPNALHCFDTVLRLAPRREFSVSGAAAISASMRRPDRALAYWQRAMQINPWMVRYRAESAAALAMLGRWPACEAACRETLEAFPDSNRSRQLLIESLLAQGKTEEATTEFELWLRFRPADPEQLRNWFKNHPLRSASE